MRKIKTYQAIKHESPDVNQRLNDFNMLLNKFKELIGPDCNALLIGIVKNRPDNIERNDYIIAGVGYSGYRTQLAEYIVEYVRLMNEGKVR